MPGESDYRFLSYNWGLNTEDSGSMLNSLKADSSIM